MNQQKRDALAMYIMIMSVLRFTDKPSRVVSDVRQKLWKDMRKEFLKSVKGSSTKQPTKEYTEVNEAVANAWDMARRELVPKEAELQSSLAELVQHLWNRLNNNPYQEMYITERNIMRVINSYLDSPTKQDREAKEVLEYTNNSRKLVDRFYEILGIKKGLLATRKQIIKQNLIVEGKTIKEEFR